MAEVVVLGTAQDGGVPHAGCLCPNCVAARADTQHRHLPVSIGIVSGDEMALVDATNAFEEQMHALWSRTSASKVFATERYQPPGTVILTHAHTGHYVGLWQFDRSVLAASGVRVVGPPLTIKFLQDNEPWAQMRADGFIYLEALAFDTPFAPIDGVTVTLIEVPHRSEWATDTAALLIEGPTGSLLYLPDIDSWDEWDRNLVEMVRAVDIALLDGCFWQAPNRAGVPHPPMIETMDRLQGLVDLAETRVVFTHLNHSNPAFTPDSQERQGMERRGFGVAIEGDTFEL
jgi:pyrroloquinoline quinone biosynthesis protein B